MIANNIANNNVPAAPPVVATHFLRAIIMKISPRSITIFIAIVGSLGAISQSAAKSPMPVQVTNTDSNPIPVTGTLDIGGTTSVNIANSDSDPVPVFQSDNPDRSPYVEFGSATLNPPFVNAFIQFPTPPGMRYIIEQASVTCTTPSDTDQFTQAQLTVTKAVSSNSAVSFGSPVVVLEKRGPSFFGGYVWTGSANVKLISDANPLVANGSGAVSFNIFHTDTTVAATCFATLFGHSVGL